MYIDSLELAWVLYRQAGRQAGRQASRHIAIAVREKAAPRGRETFDDKLYVSLTAWKSERGREGREVDS